MTLTFVIIVLGVRMKKFKKVLLIKKSCDNYLSYLMRNIALKISDANSCILDEIEEVDYNNEFGKIEIPSIILLKNNKVIDILSGFCYLKNIPKI